MKILVREQIKTLLTQKGKRQKDLVKKLSEITGKKYTESCFSHRLKNGKITYNEILIISEILGYDINFTDNNKCLI